ncbi:amidohydrolase family protein [Corynebacterium sp.]|uniref:amidohydrolase family protein n=1 Tax=Corynebacterium sp. TaxID=1720 RepID=UPI0028ADE682|nr:amidohydrolase family protein [Corynebacterium sp.]
MTDTNAPPAGKKNVLPWIIVAALAIIALIVWFAVAAGSDSGEPEANAEDSLPREADVTVTEGTNITATAAPDGSTVMDLHGMLYRVPEGGGEAEKLSDPEHEVARPHVGPDGRIVYQSYDGGDFGIWVSEPDGSDREKITDGYFDYREPHWSPDGKQIAFSSDRDKGSYDIWTIDIDSGEFTQWTSDPGDETQPSWSPDGTEIVYVNGNEVATVNPDGDTETLVRDPDPEEPGDEEASEDEGVTVHAPAMSPDGEHVAWVRHDENVADLMLDDKPVTEGEDVFPFTPSWTGDNQLVYTADGKLRNRALDADEPEDIPFEATFSIPGADYDKKPHDFDNTESRQATVLTPQLSPDGKSVLFVALGDVWHMPIDGEPEQITDDEFHEVDPAFSPDGTEIAYASDKAGTQDIYVRSLENDDETRITSIDGAEVAPSFSPDGSRMAFQDQDGATYVLDREDNNVRELIPEIFGPGRPTWSEDGSTIALAAVKEYSERFREGTSQILTVDVESGEQTFQAPGEQDSSISTRGDDGPVWSPDGTSLAFIVNSQLFTMDVDDSGQATGEPEPLNDDIADAPSWSGDSSRLLYLSGDEMKLADVESGDAETIEVPLDVEPDIASGTQTIQAGAIWDGTTDTLRENVDIVVKDNRIDTITDRDEQDPQGDVIDLKDKTVMPGLMDAHIHQGLESRFFGDRQGRINLAYGVTSTLSVGDQAYRAMENRDAVDAGKRAGPRFYATGEPVDGSRVYYNFMRPTDGDADIQRELDRAENLDYDFFKTYVRLPAAGMEKVIETAHDRGLPSASHYMAPGTFLGQDGTTHLAATQRLGYARTQSETGHTYDDIPAIYGEGNRSMTTTLFSGDFMLADDLTSDPKFQLFPSWKQEELMEAFGENDEYPSDPDCQTAECREAQAFDRAREAGAQVLVGTDAPLDHVGLGMHTNLREMVGYGWDPADALRAATVNPARFLGIDSDVGTLEPGKVADLIAVDGNPLEDIDTLMNVQLTMVGGKVYTAGDLGAPFSNATDDAPDTPDRADTAPVPPATRIDERTDAAVASPEHLEVGDGDGHDH